MYLLTIHRPSPDLSIMIAPALVQSRGQVEDAVGNLAAQWGVFHDGWWRIGEYQEVAKFTALPLAGSASDDEPIETFPFEAWLTLCIAGKRGLPIMPGNVREVPLP